MVQLLKTICQRLKTGIPKRLVPLVCILALSDGVTGQAFLHPLSQAEVEWVRETLLSMKKDPRGPYLRLRWFCADGTVHPPAGAPCSTRGGGVQHAEPKESTKRLAELDFNVDNILQAFTYPEFVDADQDYYRLKELVLQKYLQERDDGWIYRRARFYRGARQIEDEQRQGQTFLEKLFSDPEWLQTNYLLAVQLMPVVPHAGSVEQSTRKIRNLASEISDQDPSFLELRNKIHSFPSEDDLIAIERYISATDHSPQMTEKLQTLLQALKQQYQGGYRMETLKEFQKKTDPRMAAQLAGLETTIRQEEHRATYSLLAQLSLEIRRKVTRNSDGTSNVMLLDLNHLLQEEAFVTVQSVTEERSPDLARRELLKTLSDHFELAAGAGFISIRELQALRLVLSQLDAAGELKAGTYKEKIHYLANALEWARATSRQLFAPVYERYEKVEPLASGFLDALLRSSVLLALAGDLNLLEQDADRQLSRSHFIGDVEISRGLRGLNPGLAVGTLQIVNRPPHDWRPDPETIYVIPETLPELRPVAGVFTLEAGNLLSHVQLLARNLGIPNASVSSDLLSQLRKLEGKQVFYAVTPKGTVVVKDVKHLNETEKSLISARSKAPEKVELDVSRLNLDRIKPIPLHRLRASDSGVIVGPKAANLGQLAAYFPDRVAPGVALPFGMFAAHVDRPFDSKQTVLQQLEEAFQKADQMRAEGREERQIDEFMFERLAYFRKAVVELEWKEELRSLVVTAIDETFGDSLNEGVFVRSDTNVEDLPQFSGAGLNLTVPNQRGVENILDSIKKVWASPFSERAYLWRKSILKTTGNIYPSVLLLKSVPSEKSGVLITAGVAEGDPSLLTVVAAEGVGGAVEGEPAETLILEEDGDVKLVSQARSPVQKVLINDGAGGIALAPTSRQDFLLSQGDLQHIRHIVRELKSKLPPDQRSVVWDIEFGFLQGKLWLFQMRPFVGFRDSGIIQRLNELDRETVEEVDKFISLNDAIRS